MNDIAAIVILYNPDSTVVSNIQSYLPFVDHLYIAENSATATELKSFSNSSSVTYLHDGDNKGIAFRLNEACHLAIKKGYKWLLTMDQDSLFDEETLQQYLYFIDGFPQNETVAMFGLENDDRLLKPDKAHFKQVQTLITSGSVINLLLYNRIGGFDEKLFIDLVDFEYCLKAIITGFQIIKFTGLLLHHRIGEAVEKHSLKNLKKTERSFHSPLRLYYMFRNYLFLKKLYGKEFPEVFLSFKKDLFHRIKNNMLYKTERFTTIKYMLLAWQHYKQDKMGKYATSI